MIDFAERFQQIELEIADEMGPFYLFALFLREGARNMWDVVVSAPWIAADEIKALRYIAGKVQDSLTTDQLLNVSRIVLIDPDNPALKSMQKAFQTRHGLLELKDSTFFNLPIEHAYIVTSSKDAA